MSEPTNKFYSCPMELTLDLLARKGKPSLLRHLSKGTASFAELNQKLPLSGKRMVNQVLRELERDGLVKKSVHFEAPVRVEYSLEEEGRRLGDILEAMSHFGRSYANDHQVDLLLSEEIADDLLSRSASEHSVVKVLRD